MKTSVFMATSLDEFIARLDGELVWLGAPPEDGAEVYGYKKFMATVGVLVMGRNTYEKVLTRLGLPARAPPRSLARRVNLFQAA